MKNLHRFFCYFLVTMLHLKRTVSTLCKHEYPFPYLKPMSKCLLIAEDDEDNRDLMIFMIERSKLDLRLVVAENGAEAVQLAKLELPDLILMDMQMPVMDGYEAVKKIKGDSLTRSIPIIAFTAQARSEDRELTRSIGCAEHYTKPMDPEELLKLIRKYTNL